MQWRNSFAHCFLLQLVQQQHLVLLFFIMQWFVHESPLGFGAGLEDMDSRREDLFSFPFNDVLVEDSEGLSLDLERGALWLILLVALNKTHTHIHAHTKLVFLWLYKSTLRRLWLGFTKKKLIDWFIDWKPNISLKPSVLNIWPNWLLGSKLPQNGHISPLKFETVLVRIPSIWAWCKTCKNRSHWINFVAEKLLIYLQV